jgi:hypothetical protein
VSPRKKSKPTPRTRSPLYPLVLRASARVGTSQRLAELVGMSLSAMLRGAKTGQLSTDSMLAIAEQGGVDPLVLLRAAGKGDAADRIHRLFGPPPSRRCRPTNARSSRSMTTQSGNCGASSMG